MKKYFKFTKVRENFKLFTLFIVINIIGQCYAKWAVSDMIKTDFTIAGVWILIGLIVDWVQIINDNLKSDTVIKKYFKFTKFRESFKPCIVLMTAIIVDQWHNTRMSIGQIMKTDGIILLICVFTTLIMDWVKIKNDNLENKSVEE